MAMFMWLFASANRRKKGKKFKIQDFLPAWGRPNNQKVTQRRQWSSKEIWDFMVSMAASMPEDKKVVS